jgi:hypothetical protein
MDDIDYLVKLDELYSLQLRNGLKLTEALNQVGLAKSTYDGLDEDFKRKTKEDVAKRILAARHEAETDAEAAKAEVQLELDIAEMQLRRDAAPHLGRLVERMSQVVDTGGDFNAAKAGEVLVNLLRNGLQPDRRGQVIVAPPAPAQTLPALQAGRFRADLPMPKDLQPAEQVDLPTEARTVESYPDGTRVEILTTRPTVLDSAEP